jgi:hypothetical protein
MVAMPVVLPDGDTIMGAMDWVVISAYSEYLFSFSDQRCGTITGKKTRECVSKQGKKSKKWEICPGFLTPKQCERKWQSPNFTP